MELWIRSQDKEQLVKGHRFRIKDIHDGDSKHIRFGIQYCIDFKSCVVMDLIGIYKTKERALEVLDEIQYLIKDIADNKMVGCIYEMPEE